MSDTNVKISGITGQELRGLWRRTPRRDFDFTARHTLVIMAHGYPGTKESHNDLFGQIARMLDEDGLDSLRFDFRGCGTSSGTPEQFTLHSAHADFELVIKWAREKGYKRFFFIGEGLGALIAAMSSETKNLRGLVMLWPYLDLPETALKEFLPFLDDPDSSSGDYAEKDGIIAGFAFLRQIRSFDSAARLEQLTAPLLIQQGDRDECAPPAQLELLRAHAINARRIELTTYENGAHGLPAANERRTMLYHIAQFMRRYL